MIIKGAYVTCMKRAGIIMLPAKKVCFYFEAVGSGPAQDRVSTLFVLADSVAHQLKSHPISKLLFPRKRKKTSLSISILNGRKLESRGSRVTKRT